MLTPGEFDRQCEQRALALKAAQPPTPLHSEAEAAAGYAGDVAEDADAQRRRRRIQHEVDPYSGETAVPDVDKAYRQAADIPAGYPPLRQVSAEEFRRGPISRDHAAYGVNHDPPAPAPVPSAPPGPAMVARPLITDRQSRPCAPGGC